MRHAITRVLDSPHAVRAAMAMTLVLGYFFIFVWAPHPWSWQGIDAYHELAKALARGESFPTTDVPWGYAGYAAFFYQVVGERLWVPLVFQATLNALSPLLLYHLVAPVAGRRVATLSALFLGIFSFNTVYASTQSSDALCTVIFLAGLLALQRALQQRRWRLFVAAGICFGVAPQFRPNLVLLPAVVALTLLILLPRGRRSLAQVGAFIAFAGILQVPWIVRNYQLTGLLLPTSTHGGIQLWYGTLQTGAYLESRAHNPRSHFAEAPFTYTSMWWKPLDVRAGYTSCFDAVASPPRLVYWTDRDTQHRVVDAAALPASARYELPAQPAGTTVYYFFEETRGTESVTTPPGGDANPFVVFVSDDHLGDLDRHGDLLDAFDIIRSLRHIAWREPLPSADRLDLAEDGRVDLSDVDAMVRATSADLLQRAPSAPLRIDASPQRVTLRFPDGSWIAVPRDYDGTQTGIDVSLDGELAPAVLSRARTYTSLRFPVRRGACAPAVDVTVNEAFYLREPHMMQRYLALAWDNIRRDRAGFVVASLYRAFRLFVVRGTGDAATAQQFHGSSWVYPAATALSLFYLAVFSAGALIAWRRYRPLTLLLIPILYVPMSICFVLTNMRYTVTIQPLMFAFVAVALATVMKLDESTAPERPVSAPITSATDGA